MKIKICGLNDETAVAAAVGAGADAIGFVFAESPRRVTPARARALCEALPGGVARVAVMHHPGMPELREVLEVFEPDVLQSDAEDFKSLEVRRGPLLLPVYREGVTAPGLFVSRPERARFVPDFLYEGAYSGRGQTVDWAHAAHFACRGRMVLAGGLTPANVAEAIARVRPWGVDVSSGVESAPGRKDPRLIEEFISAARAAEEKLLEELQS